MAIREFKNKKGITYEVRINYKDKYGLKKYYSKRGFTSKRQAQNHEKIMVIVSRWLTLRDSLLYNKVS